MNQFQRLSTISLSSLGAVLIAWGSDGGLVVADLETAYLRSKVEVQDGLLGNAARTPALRIGVNELNQQGAQDLGDFSRYAVNVDVPFDAGSGDGLVPYLSSGNSSINIRGVEGNRIQLTVDGVPQAPSFIANSFNQSAEGPGGTGRDFFDPALYEELQVVKGPSLTAYAGGALGGAVNLQSPEVDDLLQEQSFLFQQSFGYYSANDALHAMSTVGGRAGALSIFARYSYREGEESDNNGEHAANPSEFSSDAVLFKASYMLNDVDQITFTAEHFKKDQATEVDSAEAADNYYANVRVYTEEARERSRFSLNYRNESLDTIWANAFAISVFYQETVSETYNIQQGGIPGFTSLLRDREQTNRHEIESYGGSLQFEKQASFSDSEHALRLGVNYQQQSLKNDFLRTDYLPPGIGTSNLLGFAPTSSIRLGLFASDTITFGSAGEWTLAPSLRFDYYQVQPDASADYEARRLAMESDLGESVPTAAKYRDSSFSASLDLARQLNAHWRWHAGYTLTSRMPTEEELSLVFTHGSNFVVMPNPDLEPELGQSIESGISGAFDWGHVQANVFYSQYQDYIDASYLVRASSFSTVGIQQPRNVGEVNIHGFELSGDLDLSRLHADLLGYQIGFSTGQSFGENTSEGTWLDTVDPWKSVAWLAYQEPDSERYGLRLTATYVGAKHRVGDSETTPSSAYFLLDLSAFYQVSEHFKIVTGVNNLLDRSYYKWSTLRRAVGHSDVVTDRLTEPGRNFFINATLHF